VPIRRSPVHLVGTPDRLAAKWLLRPREQLNLLILRVKARGLRLRFAIGIRIDSMGVICGKETGPRSRGGSSHSPPRFP
jgi:hypothetical protein